MCDGDIAMTAKNPTIAAQSGPLLAIHALIERSAVNGPGERFTVWTQGCSKACVGCFNPGTWPFIVPTGPLLPLHPHGQGGAHDDTGSFPGAGSRGTADTGDEIAGATAGEKNSQKFWVPDLLAGHILCHNPSGITITGGDPLEQPIALQALLRALHDPVSGQPRGIPRGIICYTGYTWEEIGDIPAARDCLPFIDLLIDGRYIAAQRHVVGIAGSLNQRYHYHPGPGRGRSRIGGDASGGRHRAEATFALGDTASAAALSGFGGADRALLKKLGLKVVRS